MQEQQSLLTLLVERFDQLEARVEAVKTGVEELLKENEIRKKRAAAGRKSAEARAMKGAEAQFVPNKTFVPNKLTKSVRNKSEASPGPIVWEAYAAAYRSRYTVDPVRNAKVNAQCLQLAKTVGVTDACDLVSYYVSRSDAFYVKSSHPLGLCILEIQKLRTERFTGNVVTMTDARRIELDSANERAVEQYVSQQSIDLGRQ